jgi:hypothetical protein
LAAAELVNAVRQCKQCVDANGEEVWVVPARSNSELLSLLKASKHVIPLVNACINSVRSHGHICAAGNVDYISFKRGRRIKTLSAGDVNVLALRRIEHEDVSVVTNNIVDNRQVLLRVARPRFDVRTSIFWNALVEKERTRYRVQLVDDAVNRTIRPVSKVRNGKMCVRTELVRFRWIRSMSGDVLEVLKQLGAVVVSHDKARNVDQSSMVLVV